jgi:rhodanese-related sulfurtransferase
MKHSEAFEKLVSEVRPRVSETSIEALIAKQANNDPFTLIDVREDNEWSNGCINQAFHLGRGIIERDIEKHFPDRNACLVLYCGGGYRSALAADNLQKMGYKNVHSLEGGFRAWSEKGLAVSKPPLTDK